MKNRNRTGHWSRHLEVYDLFQMNFSSYLQMIHFHKMNMTGLTKILDSGAGTGNVTLELLKDGHIVVAIDNNETALKILKGKCRAYGFNLDIKQCDLNKSLNLQTQTFDGVVSSIVIPFLDKTKTYFREIYRVLRPKGVLSLSAWVPKGDVFSDEHMLPKLEKELTEKNVLPRYEKEWQSIRGTTKKNQKTIIDKGLQKEDVANLLKEAGFADIKEYKNPYGDLAYFATAQKP